MAINKSYWQHKKNIPATPKEKGDILGYEIDMFRGTCKVINSNPSGWLEQNLLTESLAIHTRILVDFFYPKKRYENDIVAQDFMSRGKDWKKIRPTITQTLCDTREKANKQLAHLSAWRVKLEKEGKKPWYHNKIWRDIEKLIKVFENASGINFKNNPPLAKRN